MAFLPQEVLVDLAVPAARRSTDHNLKINGFEDLLKSAVCTLNVKNVEFGESTSSSTGNGGGGLAGP